MASRADTAPRRHPAPGTTPGGYTTPGRGPGAREARAGVRPRAGRRPEGVAALGAVADDGGAPHRPAGPDRGRSRPRAPPPLALRRRGPDRDGVALRYRRRPSLPYGRRRGVPGGVGIPGRARCRRPAPYPARILPGPRPLGLPDARHQRRCAARAHRRRLPRARVGSVGVRCGDRVRPHPPGPSRRGGRGLRRPAPEGARGQACEDRPCRCARPCRPAARRRRGGAPAHRVGRRRGEGGHPQAQRVPCHRGLRPVPAVTGARRLSVEPGAARAASAHRRQAQGTAARHALRRPRGRGAPGRTHRSDDVPVPGLRHDAAGAGVLLAGPVRAVHRAASVRGPGRLHGPRAGQRLRLGAGGVSGRRRPARSADGGRAPPARRGVSQGGRRDPRPARHAVADLAARADGAVGVSAEGAGGAGVGGPQQAGRGEEARSGHPSAPAGVGDSRRRGPGHSPAARAASVQERRVVGRQAGLAETARHVGGDDGLPAGAGPGRRGGDQARSRLERPAALLHGRGGAVRACRSPARRRRGRRRDGGRARGARARGRRARGGLARAPDSRRRGLRGLPCAARGRPALRGDPVHARPQAAAGGPPRGRPGAARRRPGPAAGCGVRPCLRGPHPRGNRGRCRDRARDRGGPACPGAAGAFGGGAGGGAGGRAGSGVR